MTDSLRRVVAPSLALMFCATALAAQSRATPQPLQDVLPADAHTDQFTVSSDGQRTYYVSPSGELFMYDHASKSATRLAGGRVWDINLAATRDAIAFTKGGDQRDDANVWILALDPRTGLAAGAERKLSERLGDAPSISPDGKFVAYARDDATGVGQSVVIVPVRGGNDRVVAAAMPSSVSNIRWTPDGKTLFFGVNAPVPCVPGWSCLPLAPELRSPPATIRSVNVAGGPVSIVANARGVWPGLSPDGTTLVYIDTTLARRWIVADATGRQRDMIVLPSSQALVGWLRSSTALVSGGRDPGISSLDLSAGDKR